MKKRYAYTMGGVPLAEPVEVSDDYRGDGERMPLFTDRYMEGVRSPVDGSDIGSRAKRREHMRAHGLVDADDFKQTWEKQRTARAEFRRTGEDGKDWGRRLADTFESMKHGGR